jgi:hypothetical protein
MMINGYEFKTWLVDNISTIKERVSVELFDGVPVKFLKFEPALTYVSIYSTESFKVINYLDNIINQDTIRVIHLNIPCTLNLSDIEKLFISSNKELARFEESGNLHLLIQTSSELFYEAWVNKYKLMWNDRENTIAAYRRDVNTLKEKVRVFSLFAAHFEQLPSIKFVELELHQIQITIQFKKGTPTLPDLFNRIQTTQYIPYVNIWHENLRLYKIRHGFKPNIAWTEQDTPNVIIMKVNGEVNISRRGKFTTTAFTYAMPVDEQENTCIPVKGVCTMCNKKLEHPDTVLFATLNIHINKRNVNTDEFINRVLDTTGLSKDMVYKIYSSNVDGSWIYPYQTLIIPVLTELAMNERSFYESVVIDESIRASKLRENAFMYMIMSKRRTNDNKRFVLDSVSLIMKIADRVMYGMGEGQKYIRAHVKTQSVECATVYMKLISKLLYIYNEKKGSVVSQYRLYLPDFANDEDIVVDDDKLPLRAIAPDLFLPKYSRKCLYRPTIVPDELATTYRENKKYQVMTFPNYGEGTEHNYICEHQTHPYPGLRDNKMENMHVYPYLPCCYKKDQTKNESSKYTHYFDPNYKPFNHIQKRQDVFITNKPVSLGTTGMIPRNLKKLFSLLQHDPEYCFVRHGNSFSSFSILESVLRAKNYFKQNDGTEVSDEERHFIIINEKQKLATERYAMAAKQELYDDSVDEIISKIHHYMNPIDFIHVMEEAYNCNIFVFSSNKYFPDGNLTIPRHRQFHIKTRTNRDYIFIYQHKPIEFNTGIPDQYRSFIQCELIIRVPNEDPVTPTQKQFIFEPTDRVIEPLWAVFNELNKSYKQTDDGIFRLNEPPHIRFKSVESQEVDMHGKCRLVNVRFDKHIVSVRCEPTVPYAAVDSKGVYPSSAAIVVKFAEHYKIRLLNQYLDGSGNITLVDGVVDNRKISIVTRFSNYIQNIKIIKVQSSVVKPVINIFRINRKIAYLIYQYLLRTMSTFMNQQGISQPLSQPQLRDFINKHVTIIPNWTYKNATTSEFDHHSQFMSNGKVVVTSNEMLKRLLFMAQVYQNSHIAELLTYQNARNINGFYQNTSDFRSTNNTILSQPESIANLVRTTDSILTDCVNMGSDPYFFSNPLVNEGVVYMACNTLTIKNAISTIKFWNTHKRIPTHAEVAADEITDLSTISVFSYVNEVQIKQIYTPTPTPTPTDSSINPSIILGYRFSGVAYYTVLLNLDNVL